MTDQKASDRPTRTYRRSDIEEAARAIEFGQWAPPHDMPFWQAMELLLEERGAPYTLLN